MSLEYHVKRRDAFQMLADAETDEIEKMAPPYVKFDNEAFGKLIWVTKESRAGRNYEQTSIESSGNQEVFKTLQKILQQHNGFWQNSSHKYWIHKGDINVIDRRKK